MTQTEPTKRVFVSDIINMSDIKKGKLNLVYAPCGSGKTYFIEHKLKEYAGHRSENILYLAPTRALVKAFNARGKAREITLDNGQIIRWGRQDGFTAMTYAAFGTIIQNGKISENDESETFWNDNSIICADELSQAVAQSHYPSIDGSNNATRIALKELGKRIDNKTNIVISIGATPKKSIDRYLFKTRLVEMSEIPRGYQTKHIEYYHELEPLLKKLDPAQRGLLYVKQISSIEKASAILHEKGIHAVGIFSERNQKHQMNEEQLAAVSSLIKDEKIPDTIQVLIINAAYETGLNIRPDKSHLDYIIIHDTSEDAQVQVRGRYRGDLDMLYVRKNPEELSKTISKEVIAPYLNRKLAAKDKKELCEEIGFKDTRGRQLGWRTVKPILESQNYQILEKKSNSTRYTVITERE